MKNCFSNNKKSFINFNSCLSLLILINDLLILIINLVNYLFINDLLILINHLFINDLIILINHFLIF